MRYATFIVKKILAMIPTILIVSFAVFFLLRLSGVEPVNVMLGDKQTTPEVRAALEAEFNLDKPLLTQYFIWLKDAVIGDYGVDYINNQTIKDMIITRLPVTLGLVIISSIFGMTFAIIMGVIAALRKNTGVDRGISILLLVLTSVPNFVISVLVIVMCVTFIPGYSFIGSYDNFGEYLSRIIVPGIVMSLGVVAMLGRVTRSSMISQLQAPHILTAKAKGMSPLNVTFKHAFHNAVIPVITIAGLQFAGSIGGTVLIEQIFSLPGIGGLLVTGIQQSNYPVVQILVLFMLIVYLVISFIVDLLYAILDPRVKI